MTDRNSVLEEAAKRLDAREKSFRDTAMTHMNNERLCGVWNDRADIIMDCAEAIRALKQEGVEAGAEQSSVGLADRLRMEARSTQLVDENFTVAGALMNNAAREIERLRTPVEPVLPGGVIAGGTSYTPEELDAIKLFEYGRGYEDRGGVERALLNPSEAMIDAGLAATAAHLDIQGSAVTVNREKMRRRFSAMVQFALASSPAPAGAAHYRERTRKE